MNTGLPGLLGLLCLLGYLGKRHPTWLFGLWPFMFFALPTIRNTVAGASLYWSDLTAIAVMVTFAKRSGQLPGGFQMRRWYALFMAALLVGALSSVYRYGVVLEPGFWFVRYAVGLSPLIVGAALINDRNNLVALTYGACASVVFMFSIAAMQWASQDLAVLTEQLLYVDFNQLATPYDSYAWRVGDWRVEEIDANRLTLRAYGTFGSPTTFSGTAILAGLTAAVAGRWSDRVMIGVAGMSLAVLTALMTYSRHGLLALAIGFVVLSAFDRRRLPVKMLLMAALVAGVFSVISAEFLFDRIEAGTNEVDDIVGEETAVGNLGTRLDRGPKAFMDRVWRDPEVALFGIGLGAEQVLESGNSADNDFRLGRFTTGTDGYASNSFLLIVLFAGFPLLVVTVAFFAAGSIRSFSLAGPWRGPILASLTIGAIIISADNYAFFQPAVWFGWSLPVTMTLVSVAAGQRRRVPAVPDGAGRRSISAGTRSVPRPRLAATH